MPYSDFSLQKVHDTLGIAVVQGTFIPTLEPVCPDQRLRETLDESLPLVLARGSEKLRSEGIIYPVLTALLRHIETPASLFSGDEFSVDPASGLNGYVDFLISKSDQQLFIETPVVCIVEAKKEDLNSGLGQCVAEMVAAQRFNQNTQTVYGCVTSGTRWKFLQLKDQTATIELTEYALPPVDTVLSILSWLLQ